MVHNQILYFLSPSEIVFKELGIYTIVQVKFLSCELIREFGKFALKENNPLYGIAAFP